MTKALTDSDLRDLRYKIIKARLDQVPWPGVIDSILEFHEAQQELVGKPKPGRPDPNERKGWSIRDTAKELGLSLGGTAEYLQLARFAKDHPEVKEVSHGRALKMIRAKK